MEWYANVKKKWYLKCIAVACVDINQPKLQSILSCTVPYYKCVLDYQKSAFYFQTKQKRQDNKLQNVSTASTAEKKSKDTRSLRNMNIALCFSHFIAGHKKTTEMNGMNPSIQTGGLD